MPQPVACEPTVKCLPPDNSQEQKKRGQVRVKIAELLDMQDRMLERVNDPETPAKDQAACLRAWVIADQQVRQLRGQAPLAPIRPGDVKPKRQAGGLTRPAPSYSEPAKPEPKP